MRKDTILILILTLFVIGCERKDIQMRAKTNSNDAQQVLHEASKKGSLDQVQSLIVKGVNVNKHDVEGNTPLHYAAAEGHMNTAVLLLSNGADVFEKDKLGRTPLHVAVLRGHKELSKLLLVHAADVNAKDTFGDRPLHLAALYDNREVVDLLLAHGAQINAKNDMQEIPLHQASSVTFARLLIDAGADVNAKNMDGYTALYMAVESGDMDMAEFLMSNGADVNIAPEGEFSSTPLHEVAMSGCKPLAQLLIGEGADINCKDASGETPAVLAMKSENPEVAKLLVDAGVDATIHLTAYVGDLKRVRSLLQTGVDVNARDEDNRTPLHVAVESGQREIASFLISKGANVNNGDKDDITPLLEASRKGRIDIARLLVQNGADVTVEIAVHNGELETVKRLIETGTDVNAIHPFGGTLLHEAARQGHTEIAELLVANGAKIDAKYDGITALHEASTFGHEPIAALLVSGGSDVNARDSYGFTPLHLASRHGHKNIVRMLLAKGANAKLKAWENTTPLHLAASNDHRDIVEILITEGADVNARTLTDKDTPLLMACRSCFIDVAELLIDKGADVNVKDVTGRIPMSWPAYYGNTELVKLLIANGARVQYEFTLNAALAAGFDDILALLGVDVEAHSNKGRGPYSIIVTNPQSIRLFLKLARIDFDETWIPREVDIKGVDSILIDYMKDSATVGADSCVDNIRLNLRRFNREYSGFIKGGKKYVVCNMFLYDELFPLKPLDNRFRRLFPIGCNVVRIVFDVNSRSVVDINPD